MATPRSAKGLTTVVCNYRVKKGKEAAFEKLLGKHWPTLKKAGLVQGDPSVIYRGTDETGGTFYVEIFTWKDAKAPTLAHHSQEVMAVWEPMGACMEARGGRPPMEFPQVQLAKIKLAKV